MEAAKGVWGWEKAWRGGVTNFPDFMEYSELGKSHKDHPTQLLRKWDQTHDLVGQTSNRAGVGGPSHESSADLNGNKN